MFEIGKKLWPDFESVEAKYKEEAVAFWRSSGKNCRSLQAVRNAFRKVKDVRTLCNWEKQLKRDASVPEKWKIIDEETFTNFEEAVQKKATVRVMDPKKWAITYAKKHGVSSFKASESWLYDFGQRYNIVSRKVIKFVTKKQLLKVDDVNSSVEKFRSVVKPVIASKGFKCVLNAVQSAFHLEVRSGRTLAFRGTTKVHAVAQNASSPTHSYTVMPTIRADGTMISPLFIALKENKEVLGPRVSKDLFKATNVFVVPSSSGKMTKNDLQLYFQHSYISGAKGTKSTALLLDSWRAHSDVASIKEVTPRGHKLDVLTIPKLSTSIAQPLDVFGFRPWKSFVRSISDYVMLNELDLVLHHRNSIIKL